MRYFLSALLSFVVVFTTSCSSASKARIARFTGSVDPVLAGPFTLFLRAKAPELIPILDTDGNGQVTLTEIAEIDPKDPATLALLVAALQRHLVPTPSHETPAP